MYLIKKVSEISGLSVRTLHHYDEIGLLSPGKNENGYRYYSEEDMSVLQTIMFYKYLGFSLKKIKELLVQGDNELLPVLKKQLLLMQREKHRLMTLITTLEKTIKAQERKDIMCTKEKFKGFTYQDNQKYRQAAIDLYGKETIEKADERQKGKEQELTDGFNRIFFAFVKNKEICRLLSKQRIERVCCLIFCIFREELATGLCIFFTRYVNIALRSPHKALGQ